ncbi:Nn.00g018180.m01.CDS01 [Neocucurbitaria sp. VM-36]
MRASTVFVSAAAFAVASAQSSSVDPFPQTSLLAQTDSRGVVTGQFPVATAQPTQPAADTVQPDLPAAVTSQPLVNSIPAVGTGVHTLLLPGPASNVNGTQTVVVSANNSTTVVLTPSTASDASATGSGASGSRTAGSSGSPTGSDAASQSTGAAVPNVKAAAGGLVGFGALLAAFL